MKPALLFGALSLAGVVLAILKLQGAIAWAWPWVLAPIWLQVVLMAVLFAASILFDKYLGDL